LEGPERRCHQGDSERPRYGRLEHADLRSRADGNAERVAVSAAFVMIGADPFTEAVHTMLELDEAGYITCGDGALAVRFAHQVLHA
jgi:thioredoxin reductase